jgi:hypothetical protein
VMSFGQMICGGGPWPGTTRTRNWHTTRSPQMFVATQVIVWMPADKHAPDGGLHERIVPPNTGGTP